MMFFKDFLQWVRSSGERYVILDADGEPEFVIEPFTKKKISTVEKINETLAPLHPASSSMNESASYRDFSDRDVTGLAAVAENERQEVAGWDAMADALHERTPSPEGEGGGEVQGTEKKHDEPTFQFETIDE